MNQDEAPVRFDHGSYFSPHSVVRRDGSADCDTTVFGNFGCHEPNSADVQVAMLTRESQLGGQVFTHNVAVQQGDGTTSRFEEFNSQDVRDRGLPCTGKSGEENSESLTLSWRAASPQLIDDFREREPSRDFPAFHKAASQFGF